MILEINCAQLYSPRCCRAEPPAGFGGQYRLDYAHDVGLVPEAKSLVRKRSKRISMSVLEFLSQRKPGILGVPYGASYG